MIKRFVAAVFVTAVTAVGVAAPAEAAPTPSSIGAIAQAIDWE